MDWIQLTGEEQIEAISNKSRVKPQVIFKHSIRCSISTMALNRLKRAYSPVNADFYLLDILSYRNLSGSIASRFDVPHESPQVLVILHEKCVYHESHSGINMEEIAEQASTLKA